MYLNIIIVLFHFKYYNNSINNLTDIFSAKQIYSSQIEQL